MSDLTRLKLVIKKFAREREWEPFHTPKNLSMAMSVEASEVAEIFQWLTEKESQNLPEAKISALADELADVYVYLLKLAEHYKIDLNRAALHKMKKNALKYPVHKSRGSIRKYTEI